MLREIDVKTADGKTIPEACKQTGITEQASFRWRKDVDGTFSSIKYCI